MTITEQKYEFAEYKFYVVKYCNNPATIADTHQLNNFWK